MIAKKYLLPTLLIGIIPNVLLFSTSEIFGLGRALINIDYIGLSILFQILPKILTAAISIASIILDAIYMAAPVYHFNAVQFLKEITSIVHLNIGTPIFPFGAAVGIAVTTLLITFSVMTQTREFSIKALAIPLVTLIGITALDASNGSFHLDRFEKYFRKDTLTFNINFASSPSYKLLKSIVANEAKPKITTNFQKNAKSATSIALSTLDINNNIYLIIIESWGLMKNPALNEIATQPLLDKKLYERYDIETGEVPFYGSTTSAEIRELCQSYDRYDTLSSDNFLTCLPNTLRLKNYKTIAAHGFSGSMFGRSEWWKSIGFDTTLFSSDLNSAGLTRQCGSTFRGICDTDLIHYTGHILKNGNEKKFVYNLTLNSHLPIPEEIILNANIKTSINISRTTRSLLSSWNLVFNAIHGVAIDAKLPKTKIIIVGDHSPPLWYKDDAIQFPKYQVPYIILTPK